MVCGEDEVGCCAKARGETWMIAPAARANTISDANTSRSPSCMQVVLFMYKLPSPTTFRSAVATTVHQRFGVGIKTGGG
jgi:hypothetical protein